ncbi:tetratricopeptide (TPR) repeat protein [Dysgonomonadaceae bacterium PH5-43]|nr:tetratricopeptide (TPR) repeat protein [Dysgonomonadaceae bacterium PH5-43]
MNKKRFLGLFAFVLISIAGVCAANNERGIDLYRAGFYDAAKFFFLSNNNLTGEDLAENYYYLGQAYYELQKTDSASYYFAKAIEVDANYALGYVGNGLIALSKGDIKEADDIFKSAEKMSKKDASIPTAVAESYAAFNMYPQANDAIKRAKKANKKYIGAFLVEGDVLKAQDKLGEASRAYKNAEEMEPNNKLIKFKLAKLFQNANRTLSLEYLDKATEIDPDYIPAYALMGDINRNQSKYSKALSAYEKIIDIPGLPLVQHERYAQLLYFTDQFEKSLSEINYVLSIDVNNVVMYRLRAYNSFKLENYELGVQQMEEFFAKTPVDQYIYLDYVTYGRLLLKVKRQEDAIAAFEKAAALDTAKAEVYKEMATAYEGLRDYTKAVEQYKKYFELEENTSIFDYYTYGRDNYYAASKYLTPDYLQATRTPEETAKGNEEFATFVRQGVEAFDTVIERDSNSHLGYLWKGHILSFLDLIAQTEGAEITGEALAPYNIALEKMLADNENGKRNSDILMIYRYTASFYFAQKDYPKAIESYNKVLEIAPNDQDVRDVVEYLKTL